MHNNASGAGQRATPKNHIPVGIVGARGYSGLELARLLLKHPHAKLAAVFGSGKEEFALGNYLPESAAADVPTFALADLLARQPSLKLDTVFLATPAEASVEWAPKLLELGLNVIDLSGAYRLPQAQYPKWYGFEHADGAGLEKAQYGLVPFQKLAAQPATLVSNPGCFVTSALLGLIPLLSAGAIRPETIAIDAKSGTSGAGRKASEAQLFTEVDGECLPYKVGKHQHFPEIRLYAEKFSGVAIDPMFSTSLLPTRRGIISGIYCRLAAGKTVADVAAAFEAAYADYPLVRHGEISAKEPYGLSLKRVVGSARTQIRYCVDGDKLYLYSLLDNLLKGAASQAIENWNLLKGLAPEIGLVEQEGAL